MNLIGDVKGKVAVMVDDMIDTAGIVLFSTSILSWNKCWTRPFMNHMVRKERYLFQKKEIETKKKIVNLKILLMQMLIFSVT